MATNHFKEALCRALYEEYPGFTEAEAALIAAGLAGKLDGVIAGNVDPGQLRITITGPRREVPSVGPVLAQLREAAKKQQKDVAAAMGWSASKQTRIEHVMSPINRRDLIKLLDYYSVEGPDRNNILNMLRGRR